MSRSTEADALFKRLDVELLENIDNQYFKEPREFRSLIEVLSVLGEKVDQINNRGDDLLAALKDRNLAYSRLLNQRKMVEEVIEEVVKFQHGGLNNSVDTMSEVVKEYSRGRADIQGLKKSLEETQSVLTSKKSGQIPLRDLWLRKVEVEESLRIVRELEAIKNAPHKVQRLMQQKRYLTAVNNLNKAITSMFSDDLRDVTALVLVRDQLMDLKETLLETCVAELKEIIIGSTAELELKALSNQSDSDIDGANSDTRSERSHFQGNDDSRSVRSRTKSIGTHLTETDAASSSTGLLSGGAEGGADPWPLDFRDLDEAMETSLVDPSTSGSVFIRLLVKTVSVLCCEEDVERLLLENISRRFKAISVHRLRDHASAKLMQVLSHQNGGRADDDDERNNANYDNSDITIHTKLFTEYVGSLLDASLLALHRLLYILKLLGLVKAQRAAAANAEVLQPHQQQVSYAQHMAELETGAKEQNKRLLLAFWAEIEDVIVREIRAHLVEQGVEDITDHDATHPQQQSSGGGGGAQFGGETADEDDEEGGGGNDTGLIFKPTARHAAAVYKKVVSYSNVITKMLKDNGLSLDDAAAMNQLNAEKANHQRTIAVLGQRPPNSLTINERMTLAEAVAASQRTFSPKENKVLEFVQRFLEEELIPVIQSTVNQDMREIQLNNQHFSVDTHSQGDTLSSGAHAANAYNDVPLCHAAELCNRTSQPLFDYFLQLTQHRGMVATVLENLVRGFASAAKDEMEGLTYNLLSQRGAIKSSVTAGTVKDPLFAVYRARVYGGKSAFEDLIVGMADAAAASGGSGMRIAKRPSRSAVYDSNNGISSMEADAAGGLAGFNLNALELACWESYWDVGSPRYGITKDKIVQDFSVLSTIASIAHGCDWLVRRLSSNCNITTRRVLAQSNNTPGAPVTASPVVCRNQAKSFITATTAAGVAMTANSGSAKAARMEIIDARNTLITAVVGGTRELSLIAESCIALLRGELEIASFYFLSSLAHIKFVRPQTQTGGAAGGVALSINGKGSPKKIGGDGSFGRSRQSFVIAGGAVVHTGDEVTSEEEVIMSAFAHYLAQYIAAVAACSLSSVVAVVLSPLCSLIPRILMKCAMHIILQNKVASMEVSGGAAFTPSSGTATLSSAELQLKARLLRIVVAIQQSTSVSIQSAAVEPESKRKLQDILTEEFERLRRYVTLFDMPLPELKAYLRGNFDEYSKEEIKVLWFKSTNRLAEATFDEIWRDIENSAAVQAGKRAPMISNTSGHSNSSQGSGSVSFARK